MIMDLNKYLFYTKKQKMKISEKIVKKFQEGGPMPEAPMGDPAEGAGMAPEPTMAEPAAEDPIMQIAQLADAALQSQVCQSAMQVCEAFLSLMQGAGGPPEGGAAPPMGPEAGAPVFKRGGKLLKRI